MTAILPGDELYETYLTDSYGLDISSVEDGAIFVAGGASANAFSPNQDFFNCGNYCSNTGICTAHFIRAVTLEKIVLTHMSGNAERTG